jgi:leader peptidase (prepilin peptidase)/N-methyltransferase
MLVAACVVLGLLVGSYLALVADRVPAGRPTATGRSACDACGTSLRWFELVPVVSWAAQTGRCWTCGARVSGVSTAMEIVTAVLFAALALRFGAQWALGGFLYLAAALGVPFLTIGALRDDDAVRLAWALVGSLGALAFFAVLYVGWRGSMGDGDVRLAALIGLFLGWIGPMHVPVGLFLGFLAGAVVGGVQVARGAAGAKTKLAFGPYLAVGAIVTIFVGHPLIDLWLPG